MTTRFKGSCLRRKRNGGGEGRPVLTSRGHDYHPEGRELRRLSTKGKVKEGGVVPGDRPAGEMQQRLYLGEEKKTTTRRRKRKKEKSPRKRHHPCREKRGTSADPERKVGHSTEGEAEDRAFCFIGKGRPGVQPCHQGGSKVGALRSRKPKKKKKKTKRTRNRRRSRQVCIWSNATPQGGKRAAPSRLRGGEPAEKDHHHSKRLRQQGVKGGLVPRVNGPPSSMH